MILESIIRFFYTIVVRNKYSDICPEKTTEKTQKEKTDNRY